MTRWPSIALTTTLLTSWGCASVQDEAAAPAELPPLASLEPIPEVKAPGEDVVEPGEDLSQDAEPEEPQTEDFEEGFCADDIYAKYLIERFHAEHAGQKLVKEPQLASTGSKRRSKRARRGHSRHHEDQHYTRSHADFAALAYAHSVMAGPTQSYLGDLPIIANDKVDFWVQYFKASGRAMFMRWLVRGESMKPLVQPILQDSGVPMEFFYLAMIESGLNNSANSKARAIGTWQFMRGTAKLYGLKIDHWVDERRDPVKSTVAAARYLKDLYVDLGDWHLAMAAYNAGPGTVHKALRLNAHADFWHLCETRDLAKETKEYVPKVLAAVLLAADPEAHGFLVHPDEGLDLPDTSVTLKHSVRLDDLAKRLDLPLQTLKRWNPELLRNMTPPTKDYPLRLSSYYASRFPQVEPRLAAADPGGVQMHTVRRGETLRRLARQYHVPVKRILTLNPDLGRISSRSKLRQGSSVLIPSTGSVSTAAIGSGQDVL